MSSRKKVSFTIYLSEEQDAALRALSKRTRVSASAYLREGLDNVLIMYGELPCEETQ